MKIIEWILKVIHNIASYAEYGFRTFVTRLIESFPKIVNRTIQIIFLSTPILIVGLIVVYITWFSYVKWGGNIGGFIWEHFGRTYIFSDIAISDASKHKWETISKIAIWEIPLVFIVFLIIGYLEAIAKNVKGFKDFAVLSIKQAPELFKSVLRWAHKYDLSTGENGDDDDPINHIDIHDEPTEPPPPNMEDIT